MRPGVPASEAGPRPLCTCHDLPMRWNKRKDLRAGGFWRCIAADRASHRRWRESHREERAASLRAWQQANMEHRRAYQRKYRYGIEPAEYERLWTTQKGCCALCDMPAGTAPKGALHIDHDHVSGRVRGLICLRCNTALERVELPDWLERVSRYLA